MSIPRQLVKSFEIIRDCKLVVTKDPTDDNLKEFGKAMNNAIPEPSNQISFMIYKFMRGMYLTNKEKFLSMIYGMRNYEAMILWTDYDDILRNFELNNVIFLGWNKSVNKYQAARIDPKKKPFSNDMDYEYENKKEFKAQPKKIKTKPEERELTVEQFEEEDKDQDIIMQRIADAQKACKPDESEKKKQSKDDNVWNKRIEEQRLKAAVPELRAERKTRLLNSEDNDLLNALESKQSLDDVEWTQRLEEQRLEEAKRFSKKEEDADAILLQRINEARKMREYNSDENMLQQAADMQSKRDAKKEEHEKKQEEEKESFLQRLADTQAALFH